MLVDVSSVAVVVVAVLLVAYVVWVLRRRGEGLVARRGLSVGADLAALDSEPRAVVTALHLVGPDRARLVLEAEGSGPAGGFVDASGGEFEVALRAEDPGFDILRAWQQSRSVVAVVTPPGGRILRLRCLDDLQPLTLRRLDPT
jgi:hypothetical protein